MRIQLPNNPIAFKPVVKGVFKPFDKLRKASLLVLIFCLFCTGLFAQSFFRSVSPGQIAQAGRTVDKVKKKSIFQLDEKAIRAYLLKAPMEFKNNGSFLPLEVPLPNGKTEIFNIVESPVLSPAVAAANPEIKTYTGNGQRDRKSIIRLSLTSSGFNAIILNVDGDAVYFESYSKSTPDIYYNYFVRDAIVPTGGIKRSSCGIGPNEINSVKQAAIQRKMTTLQGRLASALSTGGNLTTFRLAMPADAEFVAHNGGTVTSGFNAVVAYVNRIKAFYRNELSVDFILVSGTNMIYTNAATDPYDNDNQSLMLSQNQTNCDAVLGNANYDIGHVWGYAGSSGGGIASSPSVCDNSFKGQGVSGEGDLTTYSQSFMDQLVFHEMGHQFGMSHSYNSSIPVCTTRNPATSVEPGSGATVMSYGFTCSDNTGNDDYPAADVGGLKAGPILQFHTVNYQQAVAYMSTISCGVVTATGNTAPVVTMPPSFTIPKSTPFVLTGSASDAEGDAMTFCWEGTNIGTMVPDATTLANTAQPPFFRSYSPSTSPTRIYPVLDSILIGTNYAVGDKLPSVTIATTHNFTVRDNNAAGGGVTFGSVTVNVDGNIGPFLETTNLGGSYTGLSTQTITWSVNGTDAATPNVKISLSTDGGFTFPTVLAASTPNDGSQAIQLPNVTTTTARIKVEAVGNIFFDISNVNFSINPAVNYTITASAGANGSISPTGAVTVASGASQAFTITPNAGFHVADVLVDAVSVGAVTSYNFPAVSANHTIVVSFAANVVNYTINASAGANGSISPSGAVIVARGASQAFTITPNAGFHVADVLVDAVSVGAVTSYNFPAVSANHTIVASFAANVVNYTINASAGANGSISPSGAVIVAGGASQAFTITPNAGFHVADVLVDAVSVGAVTSYNFPAVSANHTIVVSFAANVVNYTINASAGANGSISPSGAVIVAGGASQAFTITPNAGFHVADVLVDAVSVGAVTSYNFPAVSANHTIVASFAANVVNYTINASAGANGSISPSGAVIVAGGASQAFTITPNAGFHVADVLVDAVSVGAVTSYNFPAVSANHTIVASFAANVVNYTINASAGANGSISPSGAVIVAGGASQAFTITPNAGFHVADVLVDAVSVGAVTSYNFPAISANHTIVASFAANVVNYTINASAGANGSISPSGAVIVAGGASQAFTITPNAGFHVADVLVDAVSVGAVTSYNFPAISANHTIVASFAANVGCTVPGLSAVITNVLCKGSSTGAINLSTTGGSSPFTYAWTGPNSFTATSQDLTGRTAGTYTVVVKATGGCTATATYIITEPAAVLNVSAVPGIINCNGSKTSVVVTATGGTAPYTGTGTIANQAAGSHTYTVTDSKGCTASKTITISQPSAIVVTATAGTISCAGGTTSVTVSASGGTSPYTGTGIKTGQSAGSHTYTVTDAKGCTSSKTITIAAGSTKPGTPSIVGQWFNLCGGGTFVYFVYPPAGATSYTWTVPSGFSILSGQGTYLVKIKVPANFTTQAVIKVSATNSCGTGPQGSLTVYAVAGDFSSLIAGPNSVTAGKKNVQYSLPSCSSFTYTWVAPTGATITSGQGTSSILVKFGSTSGYVRVTIKNSCGSSPQASKYVSVGSSLADTKAASPAETSSTRIYFQVYPNPVADNATVVFSSLKQNSKFTITIRDIMGKTLLIKTGSTIAGQNTAQVSMNKYASGMYIVTLVLDDIIQTLKLVKEK